MQKLITRCGYRCDLCLAYRPNLEKNPSNGQLLSDGWFKYFGFHISAVEICCDGCLAEAAELVDKSCPVRPCVIRHDLKNCSYCEVYKRGCAILVERLVDREEVEHRMGAEIPPQDYQWIVRPYENKRRLGALKSNKTE